MPGLDEFGLIRLLTAGRKQPGPAEGLIKGIGDDAAVLRGRDGFDMVISCDTMVQEVHFTASTMTFHAIGFKAMASNISDMAAMGAIPRFALAALSIPPGMEEASLEELYDGLYDCADRYGVALIGGDTTSSPAGFTLTVTLIGEVEQGKALLRSSARPGDAVFVTGPVGLSGAGLDVLLHRGRSAYDTDGHTDGERRLVEAHQRPLPQVEAGRLLVESGIGQACNDISDGLSSEAWELAEASSCGIELREKDLPLEPELLAYAAAVGKSPLQFALSGGEDYQLIGTAAPGDADRLAELFARSGLPLYWIGSVYESREPEVRLVERSGNVQALEKKGYNHFHS